MVLLLFTSQSNYSGCRQNPMHKNTFPNVFINCFKSRLVIPLSSMRPVNEFCSSTIRRMKKSVKNQCALTTFFFSNLNVFGGDWLKKLKNKYVNKNIYLEHTPVAKKNMKINYLHVPINWALICVVQHNMYVNSVNSLNELSVFIHVKD